jgi:peptide/nickel transport system substrate-binding protein
MYGGVFKQALTVGPATPLGYPPESAPDAYALAGHALERLIRVKTDGTIEPRLATSWEVDKVGLTMTFHLRQGVKFHDGTPFNAQAVKWNFDLAIEAGKAPDWDSVEVVDDYTIRINLNTFNNTTLTGLWGGAFQIISPTAVEQNGLDWARNNPVGTGPFKFVEYERDARLVFERNDDYWEEGKPYLDGLEYVVIADATVRKIAFQQGDIHRLTATGIDAQDLQSEGYEVYSQTGGTMVLVPDSNNPDSPLADILVRQAVSYAIDREALAEGLGFGFARPAYQLFPGFEVSRIPDLDIHEYNPDKARELLALAGYEEIHITIHTFTRIVPRDYITAIAAMLSEVGIITEPDFPEAGKYTEYRFNGWNNAMLGHGLAAFDNLNTTWYFYFLGIAFPSLYKSDDFKTAADASLASETIDPALVQAVIQVMHDEVMVIPYLEEVVITFYQDGVHDPGIREYMATNFIADLAWLEPDQR